MFTQWERRDLCECLVAAARVDERIGAAAVVGSGAIHCEDEWSDIDLALRLAKGLQPAAVIDAWTRRMYENHCAVDHLDVWSGSTLFRVFLLSSSMQVDLSFWPWETFGASGTSFRLLFGEANEPTSPSSPVPAALIGWGWLYALHARSSIARGRHLQALYMVNGVRDHVVSLACLRHGVPADQGRGVDDLPADVMVTIADTLVRGLRRDDLSAAFANALTALIAEAEQLDPGLASRLREPARELVRTARGPHAEATADRMWLMGDRPDRAAAGLSERLRLTAADMRGPTSSPLYALLLDAAAADVDAGGVALEILRPHAGEPRGSALALRFLAAVHRLVLAGRAPQLARHYPSAGGREPPQGAWQAFRDVLAAHPEEVGAALARPCQTNEAGRCAALLPGFLAVAREHGPALRVLELGASAGLNLNWDRYHYEGDGWAWGPPRARVRITGVSDRMPGHDADVRVVERAGCDTAPLDPADEDTRLTLRAAIWPERVDRLERLDAALAVAREHLPPVERADAVHWLERRIARPADGCATVVFHSIVWQYLTPADRQRLCALLADAGARATAAAPLAWLRLEPAGDGRTAVTLTTWPGRERVVAWSGFHGPPVVIAGPDTTSSRR